MIYYILFSIISLLIIIGIFVWCRRRASDEIQRYKAIEFEKERAHYKQKLDTKFQDANRELALINLEIENKKEFNNSLQKVREDELDRIMEEKKQSAEARLNREIIEWAKSAQEAASLNQAELMTAYNRDYQDSITKLEEINNIINEYKKKRDVINQDILRARALEEKQDFYRIQLDEDAKEDIAFLLSIVNKFNNKETIYKLIWSEYIQKPFKDMIKRVLSNRDPKNVIYMIKNMDTNEIYIGKTKAEVSKRWTEHIKTSLNIGGQSPKQIHKALFNNWDRFSFTVLEEVALEQDLGKRESYYISFYESNIFGYNMTK